MKLLYGALAAVVGLSLLLTQASAQPYIDPIKRPDLWYYYHGFYGSPSFDLFPYFQSLNCGTTLTYSQCINNFYFSQCNPYVQFAKCGAYDNPYTACYVNFNYCSMFGINPYVLQTGRVCGDSYYTGVYSCNYGQLPYQNYLPYGNYNYQSQPYTSQPISSELVSINARTTPNTIVLTDPTPLYVTPNGASMFTVKVVNNSPNTLVMRDNNISFGAQYGQVSMAYKKDLYILLPFDAYTFYFTYYAPNPFTGNYHTTDQVDLTFSPYTYTQN